MSRDLDNRLSERMFILKWLCVLKGTQTHICELVVEVHIACTQVSPQQCGVSGEDGGDGHLPVSAQHQAQAGQPLMEMCHDVWRLVALGCKLQFEGKTMIIHGSVLNLFKDLQIIYLHPAHAKLSFGSKPAETF